MVKFSIVNSQISSRLNMVAKVINSKNVLPVLNNIIFSVGNNTLTLMGSDSENTLITTIELPTCEGEEFFGVPTRDICEAMKNLPSEAVINFSQDGNKLMVDFQNGSFSLTTVNADDFPKASEPEAGSNTFNMTDNELLEGITRTIQTTANEELRPVMNGIYMDLLSDKLAMVACDGHSLARYYLKDVLPSATDEDGNQRTGSFILPKKPANILKGILTKKSDNIEITFDDKSVTFKAELFTLHSRLIEGRYPNYNSVIPKSLPYTMTINRKDLYDSLRRVSPFANDSSKLIVFSISANSLNIMAEDFDFSKTASENINCSYDGSTLRIGFKSTSIMELLDNTTSEEVMIKLGDATTAAIILPVTEEENMELLMLQMPMILAGN